MATLALPQLRPLRIGEILDVSLKIVWRNAGTLVRAVVFIVFPVEILSALLQASAVSSSTSGFKVNSTTGQISFSQGNVNAAIGAGVAVFVLALLASTIASGACFRAIASAYLGEQTNWRDSLRFALKRSLSLIWITVLVGVLSVLAAIACLLPGIYLWVGFSVAVPVLMTEGVRGRKALRRSRRLVKGFWWRAFGVTALGYLLSSILTGALSGVIIGFAASGTKADSLAGIALNVVAGTLGRLLTTPFIAAFVTVLYFDLRVRKEAFDLQLLAQRIGVDPPPDALARAGQPSPFEPDAGGDEPPFWPPPPGWKPRGDR